MKKRIFSILLAVVMLLGMIPGTMTAYAAGTCPHTNVDWHKSSSGDEEHFKICTNPDCDDRNGSIVERGLHTDANTDSKCDDCSVELIKVTFDYEDPAKEDKVVLFAKGAVAKDYNASIADWDEKDGYSAEKWELSIEKTLAASLSKDGIGQTIMIGDAVYTTHWHKVYEEIHFTFIGYSVGANVIDGTLTDDIDGYAPLNMPAELGGKNYAVVADNGGIPDMTDPSTMFKFVTGKFEANTDYWLMVMIGGEGRDITGDINVEAYGIDDYFLDSPDCVDKYQLAAGEAEFAFFKLKPLSDSMPTIYTVFFDSNGGSAVAAQTVNEGDKATKPADPTKDGYDFNGWTLSGTAYDFNSAVNGDITLVASWEAKQVVPVTYTVSFNGNGGTGTMADVTGISGEYTLPANGFAAPDGKQFKAWSVGGVEKAAGDTINVTANTTVTAIWEAIEYNVTVTGGTASANKAVAGTVITLTVDESAIPAGKVFDKWEVVSGGVTVTDGKFTMPANAVEIRATYKDVPVIPTEYNITVTGGTASANKAVAGTVITLTVDESAIPAGKVFDKWEVVSGGVTVTDGKFTMPESAVEINATYKDAPVSHTCDIKPVAKDEPSCTEGGKEAYYKCEGCGKFFEDALGAKEITDLANWGNLPKLGHTESDWKSDKDNHWKECTVAACGVIIENSKAAHADANNDGKCDVCEYNVGTPTTPDDDKPNDNPQTGDNGMMWLWIVIAVVAVGGIAFFVIFGKKKKEQ